MKTAARMGRGGHDRASHEPAHFACMFVFNSPRGLTVEARSKMRKGISARSRRIARRRPDRPAPIMKTTGFGFSSGRDIIFFDRRCPSEEKEGRG